MKTIALLIICILSTGCVNDNLVEKLSVIDYDSIDINKLIHKTDFAKIEKVDREINDMINRGSEINYDVIGVSIDESKNNSFKIKKIFPSKLNIDVKKTTYIGKTMKNGKVYFIGNNKKFIEQKKINIQPNLPFVFGNFSIEEFLILQNNLKDNNFNLDEFKSYYYYKNGRWDLIKKDNITIKLPFTNDEQSLKQYKILEDEGKIYKNSIVDLRVTKKIIISYE